MPVSLRHKRCIMTIKNINRETVLLIIVAAVGLAGLLALQLGRKSPGRKGEKTVIQTENARTADPEAAARTQKIPGELLRTSEYPEAGRPFRFFMTKHSQGAVYELDAGDGTPRKPFVDGAVQHTFLKSGPCCVTLFARHNNEEILLDTLCKVVANRKKEAPIVPVVDY